MYEDTPDEFIHDFFMEKMMQGHPLSHSILGTIEGIGKTSRETITTFYNSHYVNDNAILAIAGNFNIENVKELISLYFGKEKNAVLPATSLLTGIPARISREHLEKDLEQVHFCMGLEGIKRGEDDRWGLYILSTILGGSMSSRLFQNIREKEGISYSIYSFHSSYVDCGVFGIYCATLPEKFGLTVDLIMKECQKMFYDGITDEEFRDTKTYMKGNLALSLESNEVRMSQLARNEMTYGSYFSFNDVVEIIDKITQDDYMRVCDRIFKNKTLSLVSVGKLKKKIKLESLDLAI